MSKFSLIALLESVLNKSKTTSNNNVSKEKVTENVDDAFDKLFNE